MQSLVLMSYNQPVQGNSLRWGIKLKNRDTSKQKLSLRTIFGPYRFGDKDFQRSKNLMTVKTTNGIKSFYAERTKWKLEIPWIGSIIEKFM